MRAFSQTATATALAAVLGACPGAPGDGEGSEGSEGDTGADRCGEQRRPPGVPDDETATVSLLEHDAWVQIDADADPMAAHRPSEIDCGPLGWTVDWDGFEVQTIECNYMGASQPTPVPLCEGDTLHFDFQHYNLVSSGPAQAHMAVLVGEQVLLDHTVDIDPDAGAAAEKWDEMHVVEHDLPAGTPIYLHVHNHGFNTYKILEVDLSLPPLE